MKILGFKQYNYTNKAGEKRSLVYIYGYYPLKCDDKTQVTCGYASLKDALCVSLSDFKRFDIKKHYEEGNNIEFLFNSRGSLAEVKVI